MITDLNLNEFINNFIHLKRLYSEMKKESNDDKSSSSSARQNKRRNTFAVVDIPPNLTNKRQDTIKNNSDLFNKSFDDINESKYVN